MIETKKFAINKVFSYNKRKWYQFWKKDIKNLMIKGVVFENPIFPGRADLFCQIVIIDLDENYMFAKHYYPGEITADKLAEMIDEMTCNPYKFENQ